ncbi:MAG: guanylate kinase, partial [Lachnospiraceae bacterium]|nr:guanylate kinase [Lachnospiraceae bacterium]
MAPRGTLTVVSGFSGVGKGSVMNSLLSRYEGYALSVSATTRDPRPGEVHGVAYYFISKDEFEEMIVSDGLVEYAEYCGNYYGTPKAFVEQQLKEGMDVILEIEIQGAMKVRKLFPDATLVFVMPPSAQALFERLTKRGTESRETIEGRI